MPINPAFRMAFAIMVSLSAYGSGSEAQEISGLSPIAKLGKALYFDENLSLERSQSCASCHDPERGFVDPRSIADGSFSLGDDGISLGNRNAPTAGYARYIPPFHRDDEGDWKGGLFWDGRAADLETQAGGPPLNPIEMGMPDKASVLQRVQENPQYVQSFDVLFAPGILNQKDKGFDALTAAIAAFERSDTFAPFDSKYDRFLTGKATLTDEEELGRILFFSEQFTNCNQCHQLRKSPIAAQETFSDYSYHNIGLPKNPALWDVVGEADGFIDDGLLANPDVSDTAQRGKFRTPTLRNVAVTGPYMHDGVFQDLRTVVLFYNRYNSKAAAAQINPETGAPWGKSAVSGTLSVAELTHGPALDGRRVDALVAFLKTLTDQRYEHLLD